MPVRKVIKMGNPVLRRTAQPVTFPLSDDIKSLIKDMLETLAEEKGVGLAAPQVGVSVRIIVALLDGRLPTVLINPEYTPVGEHMDWDLEGCLSLPGLRGALPRHACVSWQATDMDGSPLSGEANGFSARILQHEVDHLNGILYPDRMPDLRLMTYLDEIDNFMPPSDTATGNPEGEEHE